MASKLEGNGLFESSRIILPEHKEAIRKYKEDQKLRKRIDLDEQELEQISLALQQSMQYDVPLSIRMYHPFERLQIIGIVEDISKRHGQFKVNGDWFNVGDIEGIEVDHEPC